jgi:glycosyltransferase involved in cell wall biosynthesis
MHLPEKTIFLIPSYNEEANIEPLVAELRSIYPDVPICFIDDCSGDHSRQALKKADCNFLTLPCNLGVGGAMQAGFRYAYDNGYDYAIRIDGDGQHPPGECAKLVARMAEGDVDMVIASRFCGDRSYTSTWFRQIGIFGLAVMLSVACRRRITDPTSGFQMVNRAALYYFANQYPVDYPEPEAIALLSRHGYRFVEVAACFRSRQHGVSSIQNWGTVYYMFKVSIALLVDRCRAISSRYDRCNVDSCEL